MSTATAQILSAQEKAIVEGKKLLHGTATERILRMFEAIRSSGPPRVALERAVYFTESFKTTEGQPLVLRWAKALKHIAENISVAIFDDELIVGRPCTWFGRYSLVYPELDGTIIQEGAKAFIEAKEAGAPDAVTVTDEDKKIIDEVLFPYWNGKGESKYGFLGRVYEMQDFEPPAPETMAKLRAIIDEGFGRNVETAVALKAAGP